MMRIKNFFSLFSLFHENEMLLLNDLNNSGFKVVGKPVIASTSKPKTPKQPTSQGEVKKETIVKKLETNRKEELTN